MVYFSKEKHAKINTTEAKWYKGWKEEVYKNVYNKNSSGKISIISEHKQGRNTNTKREAEKKIKKELDKVRNDLKEIQKSHYK